MYQESPVWFPGPQQTVVTLFRAQDPCVVEEVEAEKSTEALRIMVPALPEPELWTLADSAGAPLLEATHSAAFASESRLKQHR